MNKRFKDILITSVGIVSFSFAVNGAYNLIPLGGEYDKLKRDKSSAHLKLGDAIDKLSYFGSLECAIDKRLQEKSKLEKEVKRYTLELKQKEELLNDLDKKSEKSFERALIYGYFKR